jgi:hypothetical protein
MDNVRQSLSGMSFFVPSWCKSETHVVSHSVTNVTNFRLSSNLWSQRFCFIAYNRWQTLPNEQTSHTTVTAPKLVAATVKLVVQLSAWLYLPFFIPRTPQVKLTWVLVATKCSSFTVKLLPILPAQCCALYFYPTHPKWRLYYRCQIRCKNFA